jgi:predicted kinase
MITVITGPPCSGKTTYARQHAQPGDVIIDFDVIAKALGSTAYHDHDPRIREITAAAWSAAVDRTLAITRTGITAWIIDARPTPRRRQQYRRARARVATLTATAEELHRRADADSQDAEFRHRAIDAYTAVPGRIRTTTDGEAEHHGAR